MLWWKLSSGSLVATPDFQGDFLIIVGDKEKGCHFPQGSCNLDINFPELFLDGAKVASGMQINDVMGVTVGPGGYFLNFTLYGIQVNRGHEVMVDRCWLGETNFGRSRYTCKRALSPPSDTRVRTYT